MRFSTLRQPGLPPSNARPRIARPNYDFAHLVVDHHQAAINNPEALLIYGRETTTRSTLVQIIITDQGREIVVLREWLTGNR